MLTQKFDTKTPPPLRPLTPPPSSPSTLPSLFPDPNTPSLHFPSKQFGTGNETTLMTSVALSVK